MADDLIYDLVNITDALDDYQITKERNRNYIETSRAYGSGSKGTNYNLKKFEYYDPTTEESKTLIANPFEARKILGSQYLAEKPKDTTYSQEEVEEVQQNLFSLYQKPGQETSAVSTNEAKFVMDIQNIMEDYADYTKDDMILGDENVKNRLTEITSLYDSYLTSRDQGNLNQGKVDFLRNKLDKTEARWSKAKDTKMDLKAKEEPFEAAEYIKEIYGRDSVWYVHPETGDKKIAPPNANIPGSPLEGYTPMGKITGDTIEDFLKSTGDPAYHIDKEALKGRDKEQFIHYKDLIKFTMYELGTVDYEDKAGNKRKINVSQYLDKKMQNKRVFKDKMAELNIKVQKKIESGIALLESIPEIKDFMDKMMPYESFKDLQNRWGWYLDPTEKAPDEYVKKYGQPKKKSIPEYISPYSFDPKLKSSNPLGLDIPEELFK